MLFRSAGRARQDRDARLKDDFDAWKGSLTADERKMVQDQAAGEFNKKFRKSDDFKKDLPEEKVAAFSKILGKFFDAESEDYKKELEATPGLLFPDALHSWRTLRLHLAY